MITGNFLQWVIETSLLFISETSDKAIFAVKKVIFNNILLYACVFILGHKFISKMDLNTVRRLYHIVILGLYVSTITYNVLMVPMTKMQKSYGGRLKFLTFIDSVSTHVLKHC